MKRETKMTNRTSIFGGEERWAVYHFRVQGTLQAIREV